MKLHVFVNPSQNHPGFRPENPCINDRTVAHSETEVHPTGNLTGSAGSALNVSTLKKVLISSYSLIQFDHVSMSLMSGVSTLRMLIIKTQVTVK